MFKFWKRKPYYDHSYSTQEFDRLMQEKKELQNKVAQLEIWIANNYSSIKNPYLNDKSEGIFNLLENQAKEIAYWKEKALLFKKYEEEDD